MKIEKLVKDKKVTGLNDFKGGCFIAEVSGFEKLTNKKALLCLYEWADETNNMYNIILADFNDIAEIREKPGEIDCIYAYAHLGVDINCNNYVCDNIGSIRDMILKDLFMMQLENDK